MITGESLFTFLRTASKATSDKQQCLSLLESGVWDFQKTVFILFSCFERLMRESGLLPRNTHNTVLSDPLELSRRNRELTTELRKANQRFFSKSDYNFGVCLLFLYYFQRIVSRTVPFRSSQAMDFDDDIFELTSGRSTQEQIVVSLTGSKDRTHIFDTANIVCKDLAMLMQGQLQTNSIFQTLYERIINQQGEKTITFIRGISGMGKSEFLRFFESQAENCRYFSRPSLFSFEELKHAFEGKDPDLPVWLIIDDCRYLPWPDRFELRSLLSAVPESRKLHILCAVHGKGADAFAGTLPDGFRVGEIKMPLMKTEDIRELCSRENVFLDAKRVKEETFGYPMLVSYCISSRSETVPADICRKALFSLFETFSATDAMKLNFFILMNQDNFTAESIGTRSHKIKIPLAKHTIDTVDLISQRLFFERAAEKGLLVFDTGSDMLMPDPVILFLMKKIRNLLPKE